MARRGAKNVHEVGGGSGREYITILACGSAIGEKLPPYEVYKGENLMTNPEPPTGRISPYLYEFTRVNTEYGDLH